MSARRQIIAALAEDSLGGIATLQDVDHAVQLVDAHAAEVLAEVITPADAATIYADRLCICDETPCPTWCPASIPTDARIAEIRQGGGEPLTPRELSWLKGAAARHELHVTGARGGHWPLTEDLPDALLLMSQYLAAAMAVIEKAAAPLTVYRAEHSGTPLCTYTSLKAGQKRCESSARINLFNRNDVPFGWLPDDEDDPAIWELVERRGDVKDPTGYSVVVVDVASGYDEEADA